jgi:glycosyltransferase involved in cell wall biosynthesis
VPKIAYLINQYPQFSQTFIRREIAGLESLGWHVERFTLRATDCPLVDVEDLAEQHRTRAILDGGICRMLAAVLWIAISRPLAFSKAFKLAAKVGWRSDRGLWVNLVYLAEACVLFGWLKRCEAQHVHAHFGTNSATVAMLCRALGGPSYSFTAHGPEEFDKPQFLHLPEKIARAAFVVAVSDFGRSQLYRWCDFDHWSKIHVVRCGVDGAYLRTEPPPPSPVPRLVCVGRLHEQKGCLLLVQAAGELAANGVPFELVIIGDGPLRRQIELLIARLQLRDKVRLVGWKSNLEVRDELLKARAMVLPSFAEGLPVVIMESLAMHRPVLSTHVAGIPELVQPKVCGWLVPPGSLESLCEAMTQVLAAPPQRLAEMGRRGAERVAERHDVANEVARLGQLFQAQVTNGAPQSNGSQKQGSPV